MQAGRLDRRVELQHRVLGARSGTGSQVETFATYATVWAKKRDLRGREYHAANQMNAEFSTVFEIRYRADVLVTDRIVYDGLNYNVRHMAEIGRRRGLELQTTAPVT